MSDEHTNGVNDTCDIQHTLHIELHIVADTLGQYNKNILYINICYCGQFSREMVITNFLIFRMVLYTIQFYYYYAWASDT